MTHGASQKIVNLSFKYFFVLPILEISIIGNLKNGIELSTPLFFLGLGGMLIKMVV